MEATRSSQRTNEASELERACLRALQYNLGLREGERVVVVSDASTLSIGNAFESAARQITERFHRCEIPVAARNGEEPPAMVAERMAAADVVVMPVAASLSWTRARSEATRAGARVASMPSITEAVVLRTFGIDYGPVKERANRLCDLLDAGGEVRICSAAGTELVLSIAGRTAHGRKGGIYRQRGEWGNLPCGEAFVAPVEGTAQGVYVVDASHGGVGKLTSPMKLSVRDGRVVEIEGGEAASRLRSLLEAVGNPRAYNVAELGIGCNHGARLSGVTLEDEKVLGTCHVAVGSNAFFGGTVSVGVHLDGVLCHPSIWIDGVRIMEGGQFEGDSGKAHAVR
jgi:leucyl aminopeptidase (aminopeptidase T)